MIRQAIPMDIPGISRTYEELLTHEEAHGGTSNWKLGIYPTIAVPEKSIPLGTMYVLTENEEICGSMVLNQDQAEEYAAVPWQYPAQPEQVLVIHTLCIPPKKAGHGYGTKMVEFAKRLVQEQGCTVIRIDTYAHNYPAKLLYEKSGFRIAGYGEILLQGLIQEEQVYLECSIK